MDNLSRSDFSSPPGPAPDGLPAGADLLCLSHLRWGFVWQRPQHLLSRFARHRRVYFFEEAAYHDGPPRLEIHRSAESGVIVAVPHIPHSEAHATESHLRQMLDDLLAAERSTRFVLWYYTPMALPFSAHLQPLAVAYDCMDELSAFKNAPPELRGLEQNLFRRADVVFTGGQSIYESKKAQHANVHAFPSSVDVPHFAQARTITEEPEDLKAIAHPRIGYCGVIDERLDIDLVAGVADARPDWHLVMVGPTAKIDPATLPRRANIHYLGGKTYTELPAYFAGWDAAMLPFAHNESTRYISPTKTPEYLAAGLPVVSTAIRDVVRPYGDKQLARIGDTVDEWVRAIEANLTVDRQDEDWRRRVDAHLATISWDRTWQAMADQLAQAVRGRSADRNASVGAAGLATTTMGN